MKASSTFVEEAFFVSSASKTVFSNALGNEKIPMLIKALESFHPLHVDPIWISNPRYTYARGNEKMSNAYNSIGKLSSIARRSHLDLSSVKKRMNHVKKYKN
jgi:hypothetical protein